MKADNVDEIRDLLPESFYNRVKNLKFGGQ